MAEFKTLKYFLTKLPTTPAHIYREVYTDLFALFNSFRKLLSDLDEALLDYLTDAPEDGKTYGRKDGEWTEVTGGGGGGGIVETVVAGSGISVDDTDPANPIVSSTVNPFVEAPEDGQLYGRKDADWEVVPAASAAEWGDIAGTLSDQTDLASALSGKEPSITAGTTAQYWRGDKTWQNLPSPGIGEAPNDGQEYVRKSLGWSVASGGGGGGVDVYTELKSILIEGEHVNFTWDDINKTLVIESTPFEPRLEFTGSITWAQSSVYAGTTAANSTNMRDGNITTGAGTNSGATEWIRADLGSSVTITAVVIGGGILPGWGDVALYTNGASIQSANSASGPWTNRALITGLSASGAGVVKEFAFAPVSARYWRIVQSGYVATTEFRLYTS